MASKKKKGFSKVFLSLLAFVVGVVGSFYVANYLTLPTTDEVNVTEEIYYSNNPGDKNSNIDVTNANMSIHFLELGNKYTGDCTYIKTDEYDVLIDCGSKSNSISIVADYLKQYVTDGTLEYVIVTHAHQDHYAGFATNPNSKIESIFDLFDCETVIDFSQVTEKKKTTTMYGYYQANLAEAIENGTTHYTALQCINEEGGAKKEFSLGEGLSFEILNSYYYTNQSTNENNHSVCTMFKDGNKRFLFTGDLEADGELLLTQLNQLSEVDLYKAGHHGSSTSSSSEFMTIISPQTVAVCCCAGSSEYTDDKNSQFPTQKFIDEVAKHTKEVYVTTMCVDYKNNEFTSFNGNIVYLSNETGYNVKCSNNNTYLKDSDWFKENRVWTGVET